MQPGSWTSPRLLLCLLCTVLCVGSFMPGPRLTCVLTSVHISTNPTPSHQAVNRDRRTRCCSSATALQIGQQEAHHLYSSKDCERPEQEPCSMRLRGGGVSLLLGRWSLPSLLFSNSRLALLPPSLTTTTRSIGTSMLSQQPLRWGGGGASFPALQPPAASASSSAPEPTGAPDETSPADYSPSEPNQDPAAAASDSSTSSSSNDPPPNPTSKMATASVAFVSPPCSPRGPEKGEGMLLLGREFEGVNPFLVVLDEGGGFPTIAAPAAQAAAQMGAVQGQQHFPVPGGLGSPRGHNRTDHSSRPVAGQEAEEDRLECVARAARVFCQGDLLSAVQTAGVFEDCKEFVDMPLRHDPEVVLEAFQAIPPARRRDPAVLVAFLQQHFHLPGADLVPHVPHDHTDEPALLATLAGHGEYRRWASELNQFWKQLTRRVSDDVFANPQRYSVLRRQHPVVVPGGRFRESYYWDSYWIVLGLLACDMRDTARGLVQNLLDDVADFGFVPNGGRIYYLNRSQPPLLSEMLLALVEHDPTGIDTAFVQRALALLEAEYRFWMAEGERAVKVTDGAGRMHVLNRYYTASNYPRPESFREDLHHAGLADCASSFYADIAAGAESGWDFSSRWIRPDAAEPAGYLLERVTTTAVVPVDLNTYLYRMERNMARLHDYVLARQTPQHQQQQHANASPLPPDSRASFVTPKAQLFAEASARRALAMEALLWDRERGGWRDHWLATTSTGRPSGAAGRKDVRPASNFAPLWGRVLENPALSQVAGARKAQAVAALKASGLLQVGGVQTTAVDTVQQWDGANVWAPVVHMVVDGLEGVGSAEASDMARALAKAWLESNYLGWANTGQMHEKYNARIPGARGEGGEYLPQVGFGWSNGVVLHFLKTYGPALLSNNATAGHK